MKTILQKFANSLIEKIKSAKNEDEFNSLYSVCLYLDDFAIRRGIFLD